MNWSIVSLALVVSLIGNMVQMMFYFMRVYLDYRTYVKQEEENKRRDSYNDLQEPDGDAIFF